jgi:hypothetical protein
VQCHRLGYELFFLGVANYERYGIELVEFLRRPLGVTTSRDDYGRGVGPPGSPQCLPRLGIGIGGYRAGIENKDVGLGHRVDQLIAHFDELSGDGVTIGLVEFAAMSSYQHFPQWLGN